MELIYAESLIQNRLCFWTHLRRSFLTRSTENQCRWFWNSGG